MQFLNRHLSSKLFQDKESMWPLLNFLRVHSYRGTTMMLNDRIQTLASLRSALRKAEKHILSLPSDTPYSEFHYRFQELGLEKGWGDTAERVNETIHLLLDLLEAPDPNTLEDFLGRIPMMFNVVILSPHGYFAQASVLGYPDTGGQVVYILDQVRALENEMLLRIKQQGLDITPRILIVTRLLPDAVGTTCGQRLEKVLGTEYTSILRVPFRTEKGIVRKWISRFEVWPYLETYANDVANELAGEMHCLLGSGRAVIGTRPMRNAGVGRRRQGERESLPKSWKQARSDASASKRYRRSDLRIVPKMARSFCDARLLLFVAAAGFIFIQIRLFLTQSEHADRLAAAVSEAKRLQDEEHAQLMSLVRDRERGGLQSLITKPKMPVAAVVIMACNRPDYLERTIESILKHQSTVASKFPLFVSQDGTNPDVKAKALTYSQITHMQHLDFEPVHTERPGEITAYYKIARHYKWALDELFIKKNFHRVIILEDDMEIAPDFFDYFEATAALLDKDKSIMAVSSWNDNGQVQFVNDPRALYRSDFFPGLGWMLSKSIWEELSPKWPKAYWDDWVRLKEVHKNRQFIRPEICRTYNFGEHGSSMGQFFKQYLEPIKLNDVQVDWKSTDLTYLMEDKYLSYFGKIVSDAKPAYGADAVFKAFNIDGDVRIQYSDQADFERIALQFGIFEEWKDGIPRTSYKGVVAFRHQTHRRIFLLGPDSLRQLGIESA